MVLRLVTLAAYDVKYILHNMKVPYVFDQAVATICNPLSGNPALSTNIKFELEAILSVQVIFQLNSDYCTKVLQGACTVSY